MRDLVPFVQKIGDSIGQLLFELRRFHLVERWIDAFDRRLRDKSELRALFEDRDSVARRGQVSVSMARERDRTAGSPRSIARGEKCVTLVASTAL
jgi:hypothetical protein